MCTGGSSSLSPLVNIRRRGNDQPALHRCESVDAGRSRRVSRRGESDAGRDAEIFVHHRHGPRAHPGITMVIPFQHRWVTHPSLNTTRTATHTRKHVTTRSVIICAFHLFVLCNVLVTCILLAGGDLTVAAASYAVVCLVIG